MSSTSEKRLGPYINHKAERIFVKVLVPPYDFKEEASVFAEAFKQVNSAYTAQELGVDSLESMYQKAFAEEVQDFGKKGIIYIRLENAGGNFVGYASFEFLDVVSPGKYPLHSIYWRHLYVAPKFQRRGIATLILKDIVQILASNMEHMYVVTRRINKPAINLYQKYGFIEGNEIFHGWDPDKFISLEWHKS